MVSDLPLDLPLIETKLSVTPDGKVVYTLPAWKSGRATGANLWMQHGMEKSQLTDGNYFDLTPSVSADNKWIYFSSDRSGKFNIWRIQANGKGGIGQITDSPSSQADYEPVLSPDGNGWRMLRCAPAPKSGKFGFAIRMVRCRPRFAKAASPRGRRMLRGSRTSRRIQPRKWTIFGSLMPTAVIRAALRKAAPVIFVIRFGLRMGASSTIRTPA
jgi:hypothetical protein